MTEPEFGKSRPDKPVRAAGVVLLRRGEPDEVLLLEHDNRLDFPKGHLEKGEGFLDGALREFTEETGIPSSVISLMHGFSHTLSYTVEHRKHPGRMVTKEVVYHAAWLEEPDHPVEAPVHEGHRWVPVPPPFNIQKQTIDEVLSNLAGWLANQGG